MRNNSYSLGKSNPSGVTALMKRKKPSIIIHIVHIQYITTPIEWTFCILLNLLKRSDSDCVRSLSVDTLFINYYSWSPLVSSVDTSWFVFYLLCYVPIWFLKSYVSSTSKFAWAIRRSHALYTPVQLLFFYFKTTYSFDRFERLDSVRWALGS